MQVNITTLLGVFEAPNEHVFEIVKEETTYGDHKYGLVILRNTNVVRAWMPYTTNFQDICAFLETIFELSLDCGKRAYHSGKTFLADYYTNGEKPENELTKDIANSILEQFVMNQSTSSSHVCTEGASS